MDSDKNRVVLGDHVCQAYHQAVEIIGRRWSGAILYVLCSRPKRFSELREAVPDISDRLLTERLKELEDEGIVLREVSTGRPLQVIYSLTPKGQALKPIIEEIQRWASEWHAPQAHHHAAD
ncbi:MAG: helix-turn-helix transcriptional regulator [Candidatus Sericytochromatia bacterium]|nr:helix-turn-helix transcriptional regulator [Candidatus Tanganyikabacteria bacterium]